MPVPQLRAHVLFEHTRPVPQVAPHEPQFLPSLVRSTQLPLQAVIPAPHIVPASIGGAASLCIIIVVSIIEPVSNGTTTSIPVEASGVSGLPPLLLLEHPGATRTAHSEHALITGSAHARRLATNRLNMNDALHPRRCRRFNRNPPHPLQEAQRSGRTARLVS
jgi:hypothetical protein